MYKLTLHRTRVPKLVFRAHFASAHSALVFFIVLMPTWYYINNYLFKEIF